MSASQPASLVSLPQEILDGIIWEMTLRTDLSCLSMTCRKMRKATEEARFKSLIMVWRGNEILSQQLSTPRIGYLLRTFLENPQLAKYVCTIEFQEVGYRTTSRRGGTPQLPAMILSEDYAERVQHTLNDIDFIGPEIKIKIRDGVLSTSFHAVVTLLLLLCPKVTTLQLGLDILVDNEFLPHILKYFSSATVSGRKPRLESLQDVRLGTSIDPNEDSLTFLVRYPRTLPQKMPKLYTYLPLFDLSSLKHLEVSLPGPLKGESFQWPEATPQKLKALSSLRLHACGISLEILAQILELTPSLTSLHYDCWLAFSSFNATRLESALALVKNTLKNLEVKLQFWSCENVQPFAYEATWIQGACSLKQMVALETISIPFNILSGWEHNCTWSFTDVVPSNITQITILGELGNYDYYEWAEEDVMLAFDAFIGQERWKVISPGLQHLGFTHPDWDSALVLELEALCKENHLGSTIAPAGWPPVI